MTESTTDTTTRQDGGDPPLSELLSRLSEQSGRLVRDELALARIELQESVKHAGAGAGLFGAAGLLSVLGLATLVAAGVAALSLVLDVWLSALIVGGALLLLAGVAALIGKAQVGRAGPPERAIENVKKDIAEVKEHRS